GAAFRKPFGRDSRGQRVVDRHPPVQDFRRRGGRLFRRRARREHHDRPFALPISLRGRQGLGGSREGRGPLRPRRQRAKGGVSPQLVATSTAAQLWAESYDRDLQHSGIFAVQDDVAARIVATVADSYGVLAHSITSELRRKDDLELTPSEWMFQYFEYRQQLT